jgi:hypothetical protein
MAYRREMQEESIGGVIASAAKQLASDLISQASSEQLDQLALAGPANQFAVAWDQIPSYRAMAFALTHDPDLRPLLKQDGVESPTLYTFFIGTEMWVMQLPAGLLASSLFELAMLGLPRSHQSLVEALLKNVERLRQIARGEAIDCPWVASIAGLRLPPNTRFKTPFGEFRSPDPLLTQLPGCADTGAFLADHLTFRAAFVPASEKAGFKGLDLQSHTMVLDRVRKARLALFLTRDSSQSLIRPVMTGLTVGAPHLGWMAGLRESGANTVPYRIEMILDAEIAEVQEWSERVANNNVDGVRVATQRALSAASERDRAEDTLIDAVMAWENLVGTDSETSFRTCAALAWLLERDTTQRQARFRNLRRTYDVRSKLVHGEDVDHNDIVGNGDAAVNAAHTALRVLISEEPWLLALKSSGQRADAILLGDSRFRVLR